MQKAVEIMKEVQKVVVGKERAIAGVMCAMLAGGHILLEDIPGVGKTTMALAFARAVDLSFKRMQFTPDVLPSDVTGYTIFHRETGKNEYIPGAAMCNLFLADEINRTSSKTQSALLEVMEEGSITVDGVTHPVPAPFWVIATQNPVGSAGTQLLPESQMDRFMVNLSIGYPDFESELAMAMGITDKNRLDGLKPVMNGEQLLGIQKEVCGVYISEPVYRYIVELVRTSRENPHLERGGSPRATIALVCMSRAAAWLEGRSYVTPGDVMGQFPYIIRHRMFLSTKARLENVNRDQIIDEILKAVKPPRPGERK